jgi:acyl-CoA reductase-like NAD-dependent aldehyde dehydrogenase
MISDTRVDRYYYIFDSRTHCPLVLDRTTGEQGSPDADPRGPLIDHVGARRSPDVLRRFARWCARQVHAGTPPAHTAAGRLWAAAQRDAPDAWQRVRRETADTVMLAVSLGLTRREPEAARLLTLQACTHPEAPQAARDAAHMSERWAEFSADTNPEAKARAMRARHVDWLLDRLSTA